jgi:polysaccharide export outer membrane protein
LSWKALLSIDEKIAMKSRGFAGSLCSGAAAAFAASAMFCLATEAWAQASQPAPAAQPAAPAGADGPVPATAPVPPAASTLATPAGYVIGPDDLLDVVFWREKELSSSVVVRPDGMISLPLINDVRAEGLTPEQLRLALTTAAAKFVEEPTVTVVVKVINSRKVFITGQVGKPGPYPLNGPTTVLQLIATAGGVAEYADKSKILVVRREGGKDVAFPFNYSEVTNGKRLQQNIELKPGDSVIVP